MIVTTRFPDLPPRPETPANAAFRRAYFSRWGRENTVFLATTRRFESMPQPAALSVKFAEGGCASIIVGRRPVLLQPGLCLIVNAGEPYSVQVASDTPVRALSLHFRPGLADEVAQARCRRAEQALDDAGHAPARPAPLMRDDLHEPSPALLELTAVVRRLVLAGERDGDSYEPLFIAVLDRLLAEHSRERQCAGVRLDAVRPSTRAELVRRAGWARDFILSHYADPITLDAIAAAAHLSKYHLLRTFHQVHGQTPLAMLRARRAQAARALLADPGRDLTDVAETAGFGSRWAMQRALRQHFGASGRVLRREGGR